MVHSYGGENMKWIVGLGNPGKQYEKTRHNIGFMAVDAFAELAGITVFKQQFRAEIGEGVIRGEKVVLMKPLTYMNLSGEAVRAFYDYYKADLEDFLLIYDDLDTELGKMRIRYKGSAGGHNGVKSVIQHLGTEQFKRIRLGISRPAAGADVVNYVLSPFTAEEMPRVKDAIQTACQALMEMLEQPFDKVMNKYNRNS
jgi:PTH1 family peptidyl-tRNA hydrolase